MADPQKSVPENVAGRYYVDRTCIDCDLCRETAPANFVRNDDEGYSYVLRQPRDAARKPVKKGTWISSPRCSICDRCGRKRPCA